MSSVSQKEPLWFEEQSGATIPSQPIEWFPALTSSSVSSTAGNRHGKANLHSVARRTKVDSPIFPAAPGWPFLELPHIRFEKTCPNLCLVRLGRTWGTH